MRTDLTKLQKIQVLLHYLLDCCDIAFVHDKMMHIPEDTQVTPE